MAIHVTEQLRTFLLSILLGLGAGVLVRPAAGGTAAAPPTDGAAGPALLSGRRSGGLSVRPAAVGWPAPGVHPAGRSGRRRSVFFPLSRPLRPVWDFWMDRWMELFQFLSLPGRFCAAVCKKFAFQAKTLFYFLRKYATIHIEGVWKPLRKGGMSHGKARQTRKKEKIR